MPRPKKQFALIWWLSSGQTDVVSLSIIPKKFRQVNAIATLVWKDFKTKAETKEEAKVIAINSDENELHRQIITSCGDIHDSSKQIFSAEVLNKQKTISKNQTVTKNIKKSVKKRVEENIRKSDPIFNIENTEPKCLQKLITPSVSYHDVNHVLPSLSSCTTKFDLSQCNNNDNPKRSCQPLQCYSSMNSCSREQYSTSVPVTTTSTNLFPSTTILRKTSFQFSPNLTSNYSQSKSLLPNKTQNKIISPISKHSTLPNSFPSTSANSEPELIKQNVNKLCTTTETSDEEKSLEGDELNNENNSVFSSNTSDDENNNVGSEIFSQIKLGIVTHRDIYFQQQLLKAMIASHENQLKMNINSEKTFPISYHYFEEGNGKVEIAPNCGFYLSKTRASMIELEALTRNDWKILVRETLLDVYGASIVNYSATGKRGSRPGIDYKLFKGLHEWVNQKSSKPVSTKMLIDYINKMASNKRKYQKSTESHLKNKTQQVKRKKKINESPYKTTIQDQRPCTSRNHYESQTDRIDNLMSPNNREINNPFYGDQENMTRRSVNIFGTELNLTF
ncbi:putative uncharacterized protein DDB_G0291812 isoform X2 [Linepithema humile]|uniref:putative uncharacterized protein DDB_G0291812 isoform X2 n=1 Tax=Linepithema humile TaxID=83485 RepID=UPI00351EC461